MKFLTKFTVALGTVCLIGGSAFGQTVNSDSWAATDRNWMMLFIDVDRDKTTGWNGYDFIVNRTSPHGKKAVIEKNVGGRWEWEAVGESKFAVNGNKLELAIAKQLMNLTGDDVDIEFKWNDNMQENGNIMDFYVNGDTAPGGRFNYVYTTKPK